MDSEITEEEVREFCVSDKHGHSYPGCHCGTIRAVLCAEKQRREKDKAKQDAILEMKNAALRGAITLLELGKDDIWPSNVDGLYQECVAALKMRGHDDSYE